LRPFWWWVDILFGAGLAAVFDILGRQPCSTGRRLAAREWNGGRVATRGLATLSEVTPDAGEAGDPGSIRCQSGGDGPGPAGVIPRNSSVVASRNPSSALSHSVQRRCGIGEPRAPKAGLGKGRRRPTAAMARRFQGAAAPCPE